MRRETKKKILELLNTMHEAHVQFKDYWQEGNANDSVSILCDCQNAALQIGTTIENEDDSYSEIISKLEEYCEVLYQGSIEISLDILEFNIKIEEYINDIIDKVNKIKVKLEVLFLPYKAAMWDSLESVWYKAQQDNDCECYVVPIPYFEKDEKGILIKECCDKEIFPKYVPTVDWKEYDLESRRPDIIFIHNPYDNCNNVTTVHNKFYSKNLKKYTDMLVYIPYFVNLEGEVPEHFCVLPGTLFADKVIVQDETAKEIYIRNYQKFIKENGYEKIFDNGEDKFMALGSPKFDSIELIKRKEIELPDEWRKKILGKKVLLYNTSIQELLNHKQKYLDKIRGVIKLVNAQEDIVLLWRPHPLLLSTLQAMLPELVKPFVDIVDEFKKKDAGIYDESADVGRAIVVSDAYYGDASSLVSLYEVTGKPVLIQNFDKDAQFNFGGIEAAVDIENNIWASCFAFNGLLKINRDTYKAELVARFPEEELMEQRLYSDVVYVNGKLVFAPLCAKNIAIYDIKANKFKLIPIAVAHLPKSKLFKEQYKFCKAILWKNEVYLIGCTILGIAKLNLDNYEVTYFVGDLSKLDERICENSDGYFTSAYIKDKNEIWLACCSCNVIVQYKLDNMQFAFFEVGSKDNKYSDIVYDEKMFWISSRNGKELISWEPQKNIIINKVDGVDKILSYGMFICDKYLYIIPWYDYDIYVINTCTGKIAKKISLIDRCLGARCCEAKDNIWMIFTDRGGIVLNNELEKANLKELYIKYCDDEVLERLSKQLVIHKMGHEGNINLEYYLKLIKYHNNDINSFDEKRISGSKIFSIIKNTLVGRALYDQ